MAGPWASPVCLVKKKDGTFRFCVDYRRVNAESKRDAFHIPDIHDALDHLRGSRYFAMIDLPSGWSTCVEYSLPSHIRTLVSRDSFSRHLKTHFFKLSNDIQWFFPIHVAVLTVSVFCVYF